MNLLKRIYIWCRRFRHRRGYGVHSPFAFGLITDVVYERLPYYSYDGLQKMRRTLPKGGKCLSERVDKLLFRLVNWHSPQSILEVGTGAGVSLCYMAAGCTGARCVSLPGEEVSGIVAAEYIDLYKNATLVPGPLQDTLRKELALEPKADFLHIAHTADYEPLFEEMLLHTTERTLVVIEGIHDTRAKREWWHRVVADERTGITFDLYEVGLVFFDHTKNKQHYVVNF